MRLSAGSQAIGAATDILNISACAGLVFRREGMNVTIRVVESVTHANKTPPQICQISLLAAVG